MTSSQFAAGKLANNNSTMWPSALLSFLSVCMAFDCNFCDKSFARKANRTRHENAIHGLSVPVHQCKKCPENFTSFAQLRQHSEAHRPQGKFFVHKTTETGVCCHYRYIPTEPFATLDELMSDCAKDLDELINFELQTKTVASGAIVFHTVFVKDVPNSEGDFPRLEYCIRQKNVQLTEASEIGGFISSAVQNCMNRVEDFVQNGSGWALEEFTAIDLESGRCKALNGLCKAVAVSSLSYASSTSHNDDGDCFLKAISMAFTEVEDEKINDEFIEQHISWKRPMPFMVSQIPEFERLNPQLNIRVNILYSDGIEIFPLKLSKSKTGDVINLLLHKVKHSDGEVCNHYSLIKNLDKLLSKKYLGASGKKSYYAGVRCLNCLHRFWADYKMVEHQKLCLLNQPQKIKVPFGDSAFVDFRKEGNANLVPLILCFDFEALNQEPLKPCLRCVNTKCIHKTKVECNQVPFCYSMIALTRYDTVFYEHTYTGLDAAADFVSTLLSMEETFFSYTHTCIPMEKSAETVRAFAAATECYLCKKNLGNDRVRDHDHLTGFYLGAAHNVCNLRRRETHTIPVYCHNLCGYDSHFIISILGKDKRVKNVTALPANGQKLKTFTVNKYRFIDSLDFLQGSLDAMVSALPKTHKFSILDQSLLYDRGSDTKQLLLKKGVYCYEWASSIEKLENMKEIPPHTNFFSRLTNKNISTGEYAHAKEVFTALECSNMMDYTLAYCQLDVFLLSEVLIAFRKEISQEMGLDCCHYISLPQLSFDMMLKYTGITLQLMTNIDQILFIENAIRGGLSFIAQRYAKEDTTGPDYTYIEYIDGEFECKNLCHFVGCLIVVIYSQQPIWVRANKAPSS